MIDLTHIDLLALIGADTPLQRAGATNGGEFAGPCPVCGGEDRFRVWPQPAQGNPRYWCRQCGACGDAVDYLRWREPGLSFREACARLGILNVGDGTRSAARWSRETVRVAAPRPAARTWPALTSEVWQQRAQAFAARCQAALWEASNRPALDYLRARGLTDATIEWAGLGFNRTSLSEPRAAWGLDEAGAGDKPVWAPPGIVIPWWIGGRLWRVNVRRLKVARGKALPYDGENKYMQPAGCAPGLYNVDALRAGAAVVMVEGEFCALSLLQAAGDLAVPVATGSVSGARRPRWLGKLALAGRVLLAFDDDAPGARAAVWWAARLPEACRLVPARHDVNAMLAAGDDLRAWAAAALQA